MLIINADYEKVNKAQGTVIAIGNFDGLHKGHKKMLDKLNEVAADLGVPSVVYTFSQHPINVLRGKNTQATICTDEQKTQLISAENIHTLFFEEFLSVCELSAEEFVKEILIDKFNVSAVVIGENGKFGKGALGDAEKMQELGKLHGFLVYVVKSLTVDGVVCSSTEIRQKLTSGDVKRANELLGRPYSLSGTVVKNKQLGRTYGYPTANITPDENIALLKPGVYATNILFDEKTMSAITNVGTTSFDDDQKVRIESHILDFSGDLYDKEIKVQFLYYMRDFKSFATTDELKKQLDEDKKMRKLGGILQ